MFSAVENPGVVMEYLKKERSLGRIVGPIPSEVVLPEAHVSPFWVIPKSSQPGKLRLIVDLSSQESRSVNDGIEPELCCRVAVLRRRYLKSLVRNYSYISNR